MFTVPTIPSARADQRFFYPMQQPVGIVAAITPWNYPISMITRKVGLIALAKLDVPSILKPAEQTPLCAIATVQLLQDAGLPPGVCNLITHTAAQRQSATASWPASPCVKLPLPGRHRWESRSRLLVQPPL